ncbi:nodulation protein NodN [Sandarakinorhabdus cyanobacteriorum]|uniref:Nodulation protein NodN n=1 Tax=Sandarakinorhabdus cyanobacteriorum TaxID=1981098 RepID=A0A255Z928_9SPHN|nr:MaoC family dehydratase [Sandarakinorhabdus cyanobacteriorum]OYQ37932.1 nodulation protein NodN [Sandarakinorhabdus cyanobacteriorum]
MSGISLADYRALVGQELGVSRWFLLDQGRIDAFADVTEDHQFIHVDPARAAATPFGGTVAHGFLSLSMLAAMAFDAQPKIAGRAMAVNYGFDRVRLLSPVKAGARVRGRFVLKEIIDRGPKEFLSKTEATVEIEGSNKPALIAEWLGISYLA